MPEEELMLEATLNVEQAIRSRRSVRAFTSEPIAQDTIEEMLATASRAASGGNLQPWRVYVLTGQAPEALVSRVAEKMKETPFGDGPEYDIYPTNLEEPFVSRRAEVAREMYELVGIERGDSAGRMKQMGRNFSFFDAPVGMILTIKKLMGPPQFVDLGIFLGNLMLLAREHGFHTCPQEAWSLWGKTIREEVGVPEDELVFCGLALGRPDAKATINRLQTTRAAVSEFAEIRGFEA